MVKPKRLPLKVISVGNLTLGGTGKTPAVIAIAAETKKRGLQPCILTRGYRGKVKGPCFIGREHEPGVKAQAEKALYLPPDPSICGDEPVLMAYRLKDVPIVKCADRYKGGNFAISNLKSQVSDLFFILDDGFQHWALQRDLDILLIDATDPFGNEKVIPDGSLREPLRSIKRANIIVISKADFADSRSIDALIRKIRQYNPDSPIFKAFHKASSLVNVLGEIKGLNVLKDNKVFLLSGIANPSYFRETLIAHGADIAGSRSFRDHHTYRQQDIEKIKKEAAGSNIITTEKDLVKLRELSLPDNVFALRIDFTIAEDFYKKIFSMLWGA